MKRLLIQLLLILSAFSIATAAPVTPDRAKNAAKQYLRHNLGHTVGIRQIEEPKVPTKSSSSAPAYYAFEADGGGFVIIAGDDALPPVIGWSPTGSFSFEDMPAHVAAWFTMWQNIADAVRNGRTAPLHGVRNEWEEIEMGTMPLYAAASRQLETAQWDQIPPFNNFCPNNSVAGCVAVATAIVMRYHKWPEAGTGTLPFYNYTDDTGVSRSEGPIELGRKYDWDNMPLTVDDSTPIEAQDEIARLIHETGVMVRSNYNPEGTGAYSTDVYPGLVEYYGYDAAAFQYFKCYYSDSQWTAMLTDNIDRVGPVYYSGYSDEGGHAFVLDGYSNGRFHINFGWGGRVDGFYTLPAFDEFTRGHSAILNIKKDEGGPVAEGLFIDGYGSEQGLSCDTEEFITGEEFEVQVNYLFNMSARPFKGYIALAIAHRDGSMGEIVAESDLLEIPAQFGYSYTITECVIFGDILIGDRLRLYYRSENTPEWTYIPANIEDGNTGEIPIADAQSLEEVTSFRYTSSSGELVLSTKPDAQWSITDAGGNPLEEGISFDAGVLTIDTSLYVEGSYILTLTKGYDSKTIEFVFGKKR